MASESLILSNIAQRTSVKASPDKMPCVQYATSIYSKWTVSNLSYLGMRALGVCYLRIHRPTLVGICSQIRTLFLTDAGGELEMQFPSFRRKNRITTSTGRHSDKGISAGHMLSCANNKRTSRVIFLGGEIFDYPGHFTFPPVSVCSIVQHSCKIHVHSIRVCSRAPYDSKNLWEHCNRQYVDKHY